MFRDQLDLGVVWWEPVRRAVLGAGLAPSAAPGVGHGAVGVNGATRRFQDRWWVDVGASWPGATGVTPRQGSARSTSPAPILHWGAHTEHFRAQKRHEDLSRDPRAPRLAWGFVAHPAGFEPAAVGLEVLWSRITTCHFVLLCPRHPNSDAVLCQVVPPGDVRVQNCGAQTEHTRPVDSVRWHLARFSVLAGCRGCSSGEVVIPRMM